MAQASPFYLMLTLTKGRAAGTKMRRPNRTVGLTEQSAIVFNDFRSLEGAFTSNFGGVVAAGNAETLRIILFSREAMADRAITSASSYSDRLFALIPGEITAAYTAIHATVDPTTDKYNRLLFFVFLVLLGLNIPYLRRFQGVTDIKQIVFTCGAFILWVAGIENTRLYEAGFDTIYVSVILILYTLGAPFLIKTSGPAAKPSA